MEFDSIIIGKHKKSLFIRVFTFLLPVAFMVVIFLFSAQPAEESAELSGSLVDEFFRLLHIRLSEHFVRKAAHFTEYAVLGALTLNAFRVNFERPHTLTALAVCAVYSMSDEFHQRFVPGRACRLADVLIDTSGAAAGIILLCLFFFLLQRRNKHIQRD